MRHIGVATDAEELARLKELGEYLKARIAHERQPSLFPPEQVAEQVIEAARREAEAPDTAPLRVNLKALRERQRVVTGIHEAYGCVYRELGFDRLLTSRHSASVPALFHTVMARIANPHSKRDTVRRLGRDFGVALALEKVYRMMDRLDEKVIERLKLKVAGSTEALLAEPLDVLFFDCTTLYFESVLEDMGKDALRAFGYSKDGKPQRVQVVLALAVARSGLPVGYEVFPGSAYEGHTFLPTMQAMQRRHGAAQAVCVADAGMFSHENLSELEAKGHRYLVGARLRNLPKALKARVLNRQRYRRVHGGEAGRRVGVFRHRGRRIAVSYSPKRARKDAHDRRRAVRRLLKQLNKSGQPKSLVPRGAARFVRLKGQGRWELDPDKNRGRRALGRPARGGDQPARYLHRRTVRALPRAVAGGGKLPHHQARSEGAAHLSLDAAARSCAPGHRVHGVCLRAPPGLPGAIAEEAANVAGSDPRRAAEPPVLGAAPHAHRERLCDSLFGHGRSPTHLRGPRSDPVGCPLCAELNEENPARQHECSA